jgi:transposase
MSQEGPRRKTYPSDLTDAQWKILELMIPPPRTQHGGRPREVDMREVINTIWYQNRSGCQWDMLPHDLPPKSTVYDYFVQWRDDGTWAQMVDALRTQSRVQAGREPTPSAVCIDSQEVKTRPEGTTGFTPLKKRWVVERTNAWNGRYRRNSKDYERTPESSAAMIQISHIHLMLNRLAPRPGPAFHYRGAAA